MANAAVLHETIPFEVTELKKELDRLINDILDGDDYKEEIIDEAMGVLSALKELKINKSPSCSSMVEDDTVVPDEYSCPISRNLMADPVILATGQTYDRPSIQNWLNQGHQTCPRTEHVLSHTILTPNHLVLEIISKWCEKHGIDQPRPSHNVEDEVIGAADRGYLDSLLEKMSSSLSDQKEAAKELRHLTKRMPSFRALFSECTNAIPQLLNPLSLGSANSHPHLQEDLIATILNLSILESNKQLIAEDPIVIPLLIESLKFGTIETRRNAAAALFTLSALDSNKLLIGKSGALKPLIDLLEEGYPLAIRDAASAMFNLCLVLENKRRAVDEGAVRVIVKKIMDGVIVDELLPILAMLASHRKSVEEMGNLGAVPFFLNIIRESPSALSKEHCAAILYTICLNDHTQRRGIMEEENANGTLSKLVESGNSRAQRKANGMLEMLNRATSLAHT